MCLGPPATHGLVAWLARSPVLLAVLVFLYAKINDVLLDGLDPVPLLEPLPNAKQDSACCL